MEDEQYDKWQLLKLMSENINRLVTLEENKFQFQEAIYIKTANYDSCDLRFRQYKQHIEAGELRLSITTKGFVTIFLSRADKDNLLYVNRIIDEKQEKYGELLDLHNFSDNLEHCVPQFMSKLNTFFKNEFSDYLSGEKWIEMEVDWGDYK